jgi:hypothetical protein
MSTIFHSNYYAHELTSRFSFEKFEKLSQSLFNATVDLNPHQIEAALFAFRSSRSRGAILADEVSLGKTIEAGLIISQLWAERKRRILIVPPAALREQWGRGLLVKFFIASLILESKNFNQLINPAFNAAMLAEALCKLEGFTYVPSEEVFWMHGHSTEQDFIYVTTQFMSKAMLTRISDEVGPNRSLLICCTAFRCDPSQFPNLTLKKIPNAVLTRCEWGKDDYSLAGANLPPRPFEPGTQPSLFEEAQL